MRRRRRSRGPLPLPGPRVTGRPVHVDRVHVTPYRPERSVGAPLGAHEVTHLRLARPLVIDRERARQVLAGPDIPWLGRRLDDPTITPGQLRFETDLRLPLRPADRVVVWKAAHVDVGPVEAAPDGYACPISWRSATLAPLFPVFAGRLLLGSEELVLEGYYAPPGGEIPKSVDRALLNVAARGTARSLLAVIRDSLAACI